MDKKRKDGIVAGLGCLLISSVFAVLLINNGWNSSGQILLVFTVLFGGLGVGSLWKPDSVGTIASQFLKNLAKSDEEESDSHRTQIQKKSSGGVQVMASEGSEVNINVPLRKKKQAQKLSEEEEEKEILRKETIVLSPIEGYYYDFEFMKGDHLKGKISSTNPIDIYFADTINFNKWVKDKPINYEDCNEAILETNIDYLVPKKGTWYLIIENNRRESATVKISLY